MHIPDGFINPSIAMAMFVLSFVFLVWSWRKVQAAYSKSSTAVLAISSAFVFAAQMINYPIALGTSGHLVGGTFLAVLLGPYAGMLSMTIVLLMQALFFADGGLIAFGANVFNMAVIGALSFFVVRFLTRNSKGNGRFASSVFIASWLSVVLGALACALEIGFSSVFAGSGGVLVIVPSMLFWHTIIGIGEGAITGFIDCASTFQSLRLRRFPAHEADGETMRKKLLALILIIIFLSVFIPFASTSPGGLEKVAKTIGIEENTPVWRGLMFDYSLEAVRNPYVSTLIAGILGDLSCLIGFSGSRRSPNKEEQFFQRKQNLRKACSGVNALRHFSLSYWLFNKSCILPI
ncbi:TPA: energy-coupling factor ABC transporter permease [Candidatus Bathyarchaeota archaeon]|nr:energy-coupling factor ABC transporter permease [Candidatus Bathyarchaeota archaeon]